MDGSKYLIYYNDTLIHYLGNTRHKDQKKN